jgi:hypothetical protein
MFYVVLNHMKQDILFKIYQGIKYTSKFKAMKNIVFIVSCSFAIILFSCHTSTPDLGLASYNPGRSNAQSSHAPSAGSNYDRLGHIKPGETVTLFKAEGAGVVNHIWLTFNEARPNWYEPEGSANPGELVIRMYWDNATEPAVESPLGNFFAAGFGLRNEIRSVPVIVESGDGYNCYWQMPYFKSGKITITNDGNKAARGFYYQVDYTEYKRLPGNTTYFCAQYRQEYPEKLGSDYLVADIEGQGQYVGTVMSVRSRSPFWFGEGDAKFYVNGEKEPSIWGTGTEDYFLAAWGLSEFLFDYFGCTYMSTNGEEDLNVKFTLYRWHIYDPVVFTRSLRFEIEHKGWMSPDETETGKADAHVEREDDMATVAFWYQKGQPKRFAELPPYEERVLPNLDIIIEGKDMIGSVRHSPGKVELQKGFDWTGDGQILFTPSMGNNAWMEADFMIEKEEYRGLIIKMSHGDNYGTYSVYLDGKPIPRVPMTTDMDYSDNQVNTADVKIMNLFQASRAPGSQIAIVEVVKDYYIGSAALKKGKHTIRFEQVGKDPFSKGNSLGFDSFRLMQRWNKKRPSLKPDLN